MPVTSSAKKALKVDRRRKEENDKTRAKVKEALKAVKRAIDSKESKKEVEKLLKKAYRELDMAAKKNVMHKNKAARLKSRLAKKVSAESK